MGDFGRENYYSGCHVEKQLQYFRHKMSNQF